MRPFLLALALLAVSLTAAPAAQAQALAPYYLEITDGLRYKGVTVTSSAGRGGFFGVSVFRGGTGFVGSRYTRRGRVQLLFDPMPGDAIFVHQQTPTPLAQYTWDGSPFLAGACQGDRVLRGAATGMKAERAGTFTFLPGRYSPRNEESGRLSSGSGGVFTSSLEVPLRAGQLVYAVASGFFPNLLVRAAVEQRLAPACTDKSAPVGSVAVPSAVRRSTLLERGLRSRVRIDEAGRVVVRLYAIRSSRGGRAAQSRGTLISTARRTLGAAGTAGIKSKVTRRGRRAARVASRIEVRVTVTDRAGNSRRLGTKRIRLRR